MTRQTWQLVTDYAPDITVVSGPDGLCHLVRVQGSSLQCVVVSAEPAWQVGAMVLRALEREYYTL